MEHKGYNQYKQNHILSAPPEQLILLMYGGAIRSIKEGIIAIDDNNLEKANNVLIKAQDIVAELDAGLDMNVEISQNLRDLYDYIYNRLFEGNYNKDKEILNDTLKILEDLRESWFEAIKIKKEPVEAGSNRA